MPLPATKTVRGRAVPSIGLGTWQLTGRDGREGVADALAAGYRHVDTARMYGNEREVGQGLRDSGVPRDEVWVTSKVWRSDLAPDRLRRSAEASLRDLGLDRLDLLLVHWPPLDGTLPEAALRELVRLREEGLITELGVSNFDAGLLRAALQVAPVFCDQVELHARRPQDEVAAVCAEDDVLLAAYSPLGIGDPEVLRHPGVVARARERGCTPAQAALALLLEGERTVVLPRSRSPERRRENLAALSCG